jgi:hypothetical protein
MEYEGTFSERGDSLPFIASSHNFKAGIFQLPHLVYTLENFSCEIESDNADDAIQIDQISGDLVMDNVNDGWTYRIDLSGHPDPTAALECLRTEHGGMDIYQYISQHQKFAGCFNKSEEAYNERD